MIDSIQVTQRIKGLIELSNLPCYRKKSLFNAFYSYLSEDNSNTEVKHIHARTQDAKNNCSMTLCQN